MKNQTLAGVTQPMTTYAVFSGGKPGNYLPKNQLSRFFDKKSVAFDALQSMEINL